MVGRILGELRSPATVLAVVALVVAIGGGSALALSGKNTVDSGDIKPDTVKGSDINEDKLGAVPLAAQTTNEVRYSANLAFGETRTLAVLGPFTLEAHCVQNSTTNGNVPNQDFVQVTIKTSEGDSMFVSANDTLDGGPAATDFLQPNTPGSQSVVFEYEEGTGLTDLDDGDDVNAVAPSGARISAPSEYGGGGVNYKGSNCIIFGSVFQIS